MYFLVYHIRLNKKCTVKCNSISYVYWSENYPAHSTFNVAKIHNKEGQRNWQPLLYRDCYNCLNLQVTISSYCPTQLVACHSLIYSSTYTYLGSYHTIATLEVLCIHVHRSTFATSTARLADIEFYYYAYRWYSLQVYPAMYSVSWDDGILWPQNSLHSKSACFLQKHVLPKNTWLKYELHTECVIGSQGNMV